MDADIVRRRYPRAVVNGATPGVECSLESRTYAKKSDDDDDDDTPMPGTGEYKLRVIASDVDVPGVREKMGAAAEGVPGIVRCESKTRASTNGVPGVECKTDVRSDDVGTLGTGDMCVITNDVDIEEARYEAHPLNQPSREKPLSLFLSTARGARLRSSPAAFRRWVWITCASIFAIVLGLCAAASDTSNSAVLTTLMALSSPSWRMKPCSMCAFLGSFNSANNSCALCIDRHYKYTLEVRLLSEPTRMSMSRVPRTLLIERACSLALFTPARSG